MKFVFASYIATKEFTDPEAWLCRIRSYTGILEALSLNHEVISIEQINHSGWRQKNGVYYCFIQFPGAEKHFPVKLHRFIEEQKPDVVFIQGLHFPLQVMQLRMTLGTGVKIMVQHHAELPFKNIRKPLQWLASRYVDAYLFSSQVLGMEWVKKGNISSPKKIHEVMELSSVFHPIHKQAALERTGINGQPIFLWVGRLNPNKDPLNAVSAFLRFAEEYPSARLYMIYHTAELLPEINQLLAVHPQKDAVILMGKIPHEDLLYWFNSADFFLSGSHYEGSGTAVCEAMSCGCVPVVTSIPSFRMITGNGQCGFLYPPGNEDELLATLRQTQQVSLSSKRKNCLDHFRSTLSFEAIARRIQEIASSL
jgi:glycosyltransferase involved in cell wall biosynthesis